MHGSWIWRCQRNAERRLVLQSYLSTGGGWRNGDKRNPKFLNPQAWKEGAVSGIFEQGPGGGGERDSDELFDSHERSRSQASSRAGPAGAALKMAQAKISPITYVSADTPPMLLFHELSDNTVGVYQSDTFVKAQRDAGAKDINYVLLGYGSGHGVFAQNIATLEPMREAFFEQTLRGGK